jgi:hypothetical protein
MRTDAIVFPRPSSCGCRSPFLLVEFLQSLIFVKPAGCPSALDRDLA